MILVIILMKVPSEKRMELSQTIVSLSGSIRMEKGCRLCECCQSIEDKNRLFLLEEWDTQEDFKDHMKSKCFMVFRGATNLLTEPYEIMFHTVFHPAEMEEQNRKSAHAGHAKEVR
jgi:quinol monooxygenase YgiN